MKIIAFGTNIGKHFKFSNHSLAIRVAIIYVIISCIYISISDRFVAFLFSDIKTITLISTYKGWGFVIITGILIYLFLNKPLKKLWVSEENYRQIVNTAIEGILVVDKDFTIRFVNTRLCELLQFQQADLLEKPLHFFMLRMEGEDDYERYLNTKQDITDRYERYFIKKDGTAICMLVSSTVIKDETGSFSGMYVMLTDISELKKTYEELKIAKEKAEESDRLKTAFLANISHEIRTPLNGIVGFANLLVEKDITTDIRNDYCDIIVKSADQLLFMVNEVLDLSRIETGQMNISHEIFDLNELMEDIYLFFSDKAIKKGLMFRVEKTLNSPNSLLNTDRTKLNQILINLVSNAFKFTKEGSVMVGYQVSGKNILFTVEDTGMGIAPKDQEQIFQRFRQADETINKYYGGTGLGLAISKSLVEMLGGKIWVDSSLGHGAAFHFTIPFYNNVNLS